MEKQNVQKTISFAYQGAKVSKEVLLAFFRNFLDNKPSHGMKPYGQIVKRGKLDAIEITENNIGSFLNTARKYDIDYALKRDSSTTPPTYHVFFETSRSENFQKAFSEYANNMQSRITSKTASQIINREQIKQNANIISQKTSERSADVLLSFLKKHLSKSEISGR